MGQLNVINGCSKGSLQRGGVCRCGNATEGKEMGTIQTRINTSEGKQHHCWHSKLFAVSIESADAGGRWNPMWTFWAVSRSNRDPSLVERVLFQVSPSPVLDPLRLWCRADRGGWLHARPKKGRGGRPGTVRRQFGIHLASY